MATQNTTTAQSRNNEAIGFIDKAKNPLKEYRTYSYHFILIASDTTEYTNLDNKTAAALLKSGSFYERQNKSVKGRRHVQEDANGLGKYVILIDSRQDADFVIDDVQWGTTFIGNSNSGGSAVALNTFLTDGVMRIVEPRGVNFLNVISQIASSKQLNTDPSTIPFLLKVIFVGHKDDGTVEYSLGKDWDPPPFGIFFTDITGSVDANGTTYNMKYVGAVNGAAWNQTYNAMTDGIGFTFSDKIGLEGHLLQIANQLNSKYLEERQRIVEAYKTVGVDLSDTCVIEYSFEVEEGGKIFPTLDDFGVLLPPINSNGNGTYQYMGTKEGGVQEVINALFRSSNKWTTRQLMGDPNTVDPKDSSTKYAWKITAEFSKTSATKSDNRIRINYIISEWSYETVDVNDAASGQAHALPTIINPADVYEFDYIFTGKNIDISRLDMNLSMGYALWLTLVTSQSLPSQVQDTTGSLLEAGNIPLRTIQGNLNQALEIRKGTPIWPPAYPKDTPISNYSNTAQVATADATWRNFASYQAIQTDLTILGNPTLIQKITIPNRSSPSYVKINVKMPSTPDDIWEYNQEHNLDPDGYYKTFWFDGYYNIITAKNRFSGGQFTQELYLVGIPQVSTDMEKIAAAQEDEDDNVQNPNSSFIVKPPSLPGLPGNDITPPLAPNLSIGQATGSTLPTLGAPDKYNQFFKQYWNTCVNAVQQVAADNPGYPVVTPDYIMSQAGLESDWGTGPLVQYNNFSGLKGFKTSPTNRAWRGAVTPTAGRFRVYESPYDGFYDHALAVIKLWSNVNNQSGAAYQSTVTAYTTALQAGPGGRAWATQGSIPEPGYVAKVDAANLHLMAAKAFYDITGNNKLNNSVVFLPDTTPQPFLVPPPDQFSLQNVKQQTKYSALDRSVQAQGIAAKQGKQ